MIPLLRRGKRCFFSLSLYLLKRERVYFYSRGNEKKQIQKGKSRVFKNPTSLRSNTPSSSGHQKIVRISHFTNSSLFDSSKSSKKSSSSESSGLAWCAKKLFFCLIIRSKREHERENVVGNFVEEKRFTLNAAAKTTKLELGVLSFCLLTIISSTSSLSNPNVGGEDDERGSSSSTSSARTVSRVSANAFYGSEHDE